MEVVGYNSGEIVGVARGYGYGVRGGGFVGVAPDAGHMGHLRRQQDSAAGLEGPELLRIGS
jgi:hypothetical protein